MRMMALALLTLSAIGIDPDSAAAFADRAKLPAADQPYAYYFTTGLQRSPQASEQLGKVLRFTLPSLSRKTFLGDQLPTRISDTLYRIDTRGLGWETSLPAVLTRHYPYRPDLGGKAAPIVTRADWFCACVLDPIQTPGAQYDLIYGPKPPKTTTDFRKFWQVSTDPQFLFKRHEAESGVGVNPDRGVEQRDTAIRTFHWATQDAEFPVGDKDPGNYGKALKFDAGEEFAGIPKQYNGEQGAALVWWLANGKGERQEVAPARIVTDHNRLRSTEIRNSISCIACHTEGVRPFSKNGFAEFVSSGARVAADKKTQQLIDQQYQAGVDAEVEANNRLYAKFLDMCNGYSPPQNAKAFEAVVRTYDAKVTREQAARELYMSDEEFRLALGYYSAKYSLTPRLAALAQGVPVSRGQWQGEFALAYVVKQKWGAR